jgi:hypothetical protein
MSYKTGKFLLMAEMTAVSIKAWKIEVENQLTLKVAPTSDPNLCLETAEKRA